MNKYALIGLGFISSRHREAIEKTGGEIILTCDNDPNKKTDFLDYKEMFDSPEFNEVEYVVVAVPNYLHSQICRDAIAKGKKVLCEKPLTIFNDYEGLEKVNVVLQLRHNPEVKKLKEKSENCNIDIFVKTYREPEYFESWKGQPALSGGIIYNMGVHYIDLLIHLLGEPVEIKKSYYTDLVAYGEVLFEKGRGTYYIELSKENHPIIRRMSINGIPMDLEGATIPLKEKSKSDLHTEVYRQLLKGEGISLAEASKSLNLVRDLINFNAGNN